MGSIDGPSNGGATVSEEDAAEVLVLLPVEALVEQLLRCCCGHSRRGAGMTRARFSRLSIKDFPFSKNRCMYPLATVIPGLMGSERGCKYLLCSHL
ncbi:hypothetical protein V6N13_082957 [Hibiscus sabdariffa]